MKTLFTFILLLGVLLTTNSYSQLKKNISIRSIKGNIANTIGMTVILSMTPRSNTVVNGWGEIENSKKELVKVKVPRKLIKKFKELNTEKFYTFTIKILGKDRVDNLKGLIVTISD